VLLQFCAKHGLQDGALLRILRGLVYLPQGIVPDEAVERETALSAEVKYGFRMYASEHERETKFGGIGVFPVGGSLP
jgi:hypothetical protein